MAQVHQSMLELITILNMLSSKNSSSLRAMMGYQAEISNERTLSWLWQNRSLSKDYERLTDTGETMIYIAMTWPMVTRLAQK